MTTPRILGDSFLYKDVLFLSFFTITLYYFIKSINVLSFKNLIFFSLFTALSFNLRIFSIIIPLLFILIIIIKDFYLKNLINHIKKIFFYLFFLIIFIYIFWPYLWSDPLNNFLNLFTSVKQDLINVKIFYGNSYISNRTLPDTYIINWIVISSPVLITLLFFIGYFICFYRAGKRFIKIKKESIYNDLWRSKGEEIDFIFLVILSSFYIFFIFFNSPLYNGWRLIYFFNIFIIYFVIYFLFNFENIFKKKKLDKIFFFFIFFLVGNNVYSIIKTHPFQSFYFNSLLNKKSKNSYEGDYHGLGAKNFFEKILKIDNSKIIKVAVASHTPLQRGLEALDEKNRQKFIIIGQEYSSADYIFKNNISEVNSELIKKYEIPENFSKIYELTIDNVTLYEIYKPEK